MQLPFHFIYCKAAIGGGERENQKSQQKQAVPKENPVRFTFRQAQGSRLAPEPGGFHLWGGTGGGVHSPADGRSSARGTGSHLPTSFCGFEIRTQPPPDKKERHFPNTAPSPGVGLGLGAGAKGPSSPHPIPPHPRPSEVAPTWRRMGFRLVSDLSSDRFLGKSGRRSDAAAHLARSLELAKATFALPHPLAHSTLARTARANPTGHPAAPAYNSLGPRQRSKTHQVAAAYRAKTFRTPALKAASGGSGAGPLWRAMGRGAVGVRSALGATLQRL